MSDLYLRVVEKTDNSICVELCGYGPTVGHTITTEDRCGNTETTTVEVGPSTITGYIGSPSDTTVGENFDELCAQFENLRIGGLAVVAKNTFVIYQ